MPRAKKKMKTIHGETKLSFRAPAHLPKQSPRTVKVYSTKQTTKTKPSHFTGAPIIESNYAISCDLCNKAGCRKSRCVPTMYRFLGWSID